MLGLMATTVGARPPLDVVVSLALIMGVATLTTVAFQKLHLPAVLGYVVAGLIVGPHLPVPLFADEAVAHTLSELGVILLMFSLGLEFSLGKLAQVGLRAMIVAVIETGLLLCAGFAVARAMGWGPLESLFAGGMLAISSTTIVVKAFAERGISGALADIVLGVLIVEDLIAVLLVTVLATVASGSAVSAGALLLTLGKLAGFLLGTLVAGLLVVPRVMRLVASLARTETTVVSGMAICFGFALLARAFGYSVALGAFLGGALVAESGQAKKMEPLVEPLRDVFVAVFFVSAGMLIDPAAVRAHAGTILLLSAVIICGKLVGVTVGGFLAGHGVVPSVRAGLSLGQIGEFSFIIASLGLAHGAVRPFLYPVAVAVSALTTLTTPWLIKAAPAVASYIEGKIPARLQTYASLYETWVETWGGKSEDRSERARLKRFLWLLGGDLACLVVLIIAGARLAPWLAARVGRWAWLPPRATPLLVVAAVAAAALPFLLGAVRMTRALAQRLAFQALPKQGAMDMAQAPRRVLLASLHLTFLLVAGLPVVALIQPFLPSVPGPVFLVVALVLSGLVIWQSAAHLNPHVRAGAQVVLEALLEQKGRKIANANEGAAAVAQVTQAHLPGFGTVRTVKIAPGPVVGRSLDELRLRARTSATVVALERGPGHIIYPTARDLLHEGDVLVLVGTEPAVNAAAALLEART